MHYADIAKCFSSIYTHTLFWAIADIQTAKNNTNARTFSNMFDRLMQSVNYNETNGICVGAEVSRIFAELILSEVDRRVILSLESRGENKGRSHGSEYEFRRYVDDYYIFSTDDATAALVLGAIKTCLAEFNLHLNDEKTHEIRRPFITTKSRMVRDAETALGDFFGKFIESEFNTVGTHAKPKRVRRSLSLLRSFLDSIKASCFDNGERYDAISNYLIGALATRVSLLVSGYGFIVGAADLEEEYLGSLLVLLEASYFLYEVDPSVPSSLRIAQSAVQIYEFIGKYFPDRAPFVAEQIVKWTFQFIKGLSNSNAHLANDCIPLEALNVLLVVGEVGREDVFAKRAVKEFAGPISELRYFEIVSYLYCINADPGMEDTRQALFQRAKSIILGKNKCVLEAQAAYLGLDILCCPHLDRTDRARLFIDMRKSIELSQITLAEAILAVEEFEANPWFVDWGGLSLLRMIRKKELSAVY